MRRCRAPIFLAAFVAIVFLPHFASAAGDFFGPIIQPIQDGGQNLQTCAAGWGGLVVTLNNLIKFAISLGIVIAVLMAAYAGFLWITNPINPENRSAARSILINSAIGLVIALSAWLVVNTVLIALTGGSVANGSGGKGISNFTTFLSGGDVCIKAQPQGQVSGPPSGIEEKPPTGQPTGAAPDGVFTYQSGIDKQKADASPALSTLLTCMAGKVPGNVGDISSISDSLIASGQKTFAQCATGGCAHSANSCHYGGRSCVGQSYAVDFGDGDPQHSSNLAALKSAASACGANYMTDNEGGSQTHLHVSVGASCGCN